jgi:hypothetical protein
VRKRAQQLLAGKIVVGHGVEQDLQVSDQEWPESSYSYYLARKLETITVCFFPLVFKVLGVAVDWIRINLINYLNACELI